MVECSKISTFIEENQAFEKKFGWQCYNVVKTIGLNDEVLKIGTKKSLTIKGNAYRLIMKTP